MEALLVIAHGSHLNESSASPTFRHADTIRSTGAFDEVRTAFWKEEPSLREALRTVESETVYVVPLFISEGYFTEDVIPRELRLEGWGAGPDATDWNSDGVQAESVTLPASDVEKAIHYCGPVGTHDSMSDVIVRRAESVTGDPDVGAGAGLAIVGHGTERNENSAKAIQYHTERIAGRDRFEAVKAVFMDEEPEVDDLTAYFETADIILVPLFVADGYHTQEDIPEDAGLTDDYRAGYDVPADVDGHRIWYSGAVGTEALIADVLLERARDAGADVGDAPEQVRERTRIEAQQDSQTASRSAHASEPTGETPAHPETQAATRGQDRTDPIDAFLTACAGTEEPVNCDGVRVRSSDAGFAVETPTESVTVPSRADLREWAESNEAFVANWHYFEQRVEGHDTARRAFTRWLEHASELDVPARNDGLRRGLERSWGQLQITTTYPPTGERHRRSYRVRHETDADAAPHALDMLDEPRELRSLVRTDADGSYRPLKTAPTLEAGWRFETQDHRALLEAIQYCYPATVVNWHRERTGDLDITHYRETATRQTGIYDVVEELELPAVERLATACCADSACLKRREWDEDSETTLDAPRGDGAFPCREPCSMVVSAARQIATIESESPREYTFELTPSEKNQLEAVLDAVASGELDEIRAGAFGEPANRSRVRYLRSKLLTERGLDDVPTFSEQ